ncbi:MAG: type II toxin-antitoxin system VapC family toxin [Arcicella sp.]|nr:type II toxin-antitoxin system VapC family toxin [Arcicella sp.]
MEGDEQLSENAKNHIQNTQNTIYAGHVSFFEMVIKMKLGKIITKRNLDDFIKATKDSFIEILPSEEEHFTKYLEIPFIAEHRDPFDRLLIATAIYENLSIISVDEKFDYYTDLVNIIW